MWALYILIGLIIGFVGGFFIAARYMKKEFSKMQTDPKQLQAMARSMGRPMNQKQASMLARQIQQSSSTKKPTKKKK